jgi:hypothetical protein
MLGGTNDAVVRRVRERIARFSGYDVNPIQPDYPYPALALVLALALTSTLALTRITNSPIADVLLAWAYVKSKPDLSRSKS